MGSPRKDLWGILQGQCDKMGKEFLRTSSLREVAALERKWLDTRRGVIVRLMNKPVLANATDSVRKVFAYYLANQVRNASKYSRIWMDD
jgi:hypothetical protein